MYRAEFWLCLCSKRYCIYCIKKNKISFSSILIILNQRKSAWVSCAIFVITFPCANKIKKVSATRHFPQTMSRLQWVANLKITCKPSSLRNVPLYQPEKAAKWSNQVLKSFNQALKWFNQVWKSTNQVLKCASAGFQTVPPHCQWQNTKKITQPTSSFFTLKMSWKSDSFWQQFVFDFGTEDW